MNENRMEREEQEDRGEKNLSSLEDAGEKASLEESQEQQLAQAQEEVATLKDQLLRSLAEMENLRKRAQREREDTQKYSISNFARELLSVADNLRRALENQQGDLTVFLSGVEMTERELLAIFERQGIKKLLPTSGEKFDPNHHQAMIEVEKEDQEAGTIADTFQAGYLLHDRLLRPAMVSVVIARR